MGNGGCGRLGTLVQVDVVLQRGGLSRDCRCRVHRHQEAPNQRGSWGPGVRLSANAVVRRKRASGRPSQVVTQARGVESAWRRVPLAYGRGSAGGDASRPDLRSRARAHGGRRLRGANWGMAPAATGGRDYGGGGARAWAVGSSGRRVPLACVRGSAAAVRASACGATLAATKGRRFGRDPGHLPQWPSFREGRQRRRRSGGTARWARSGRRVALAYARGSASREGSK